MTSRENPDAYGTLPEPATLRIERLLPGPIERVWSYLTQSDLRRQWLASGTMDLRLGAPFELTWRNDELTEPPGARPPGFSEEHRMESTITALDPPRFLAFAWGGGEVSFNLEPRGEKVLLTVVHKRVSDRTNLVRVSGGWHVHLDILAARLAGTRPAPFWDTWSRLRDEYDRRIPA